MTMTEHQKRWLMTEKNAGRLKCDRCEGTIHPGELTASEGWPDGTFRVYCRPCADGIRPTNVDHYERLDTTTGESERVEPDDPWRQ